MISKNICKINEYNGSVFYKAQCGCGDDEHAQTLELSKEEYSVNLSIYSTLSSKYIWKNSRIRNYLMRIKYAFQMLITGRIEMHNEFIFDDRQSIEAYVEALTEGMRKFDNEK